MIGISILIGTILGFLAKYILDKLLVFEVSFEATTGEARQILLYGATGVVTTLIFWSVEIGFHFAFEQEHMRYVGGIIGLTIGYIVKFLLDSTFVFRK